MEQLGTKIISDQGLTLAQEIGRLLKKRGQTLSVAESCTGGLVAHLITDVPGASDYFLFSATTYANAAKEAILNVSRETLENNGAVDETTALVITSYSIHYTKLYDPKKAVTAPSLTPLNAL